MRRVVVLVSLLGALGASACSSAPDGSPSVADGADQEQNGATKVLEAKLYDEPDASPSPDCDRYTAATVLKTRTGKLLLELENRLAGTCEIFVAPDKRTYPVAEGNSCGSTLYTGELGDDTVSLQDNRTRVCEDLRLAVLELHETRNGHEVHLYGKASAGTGPSTGGDAAVLDVKLYEKPHAEISAFCDKHTHLGLKRSGETLEARLEYKLSATSLCEIYIAPNETLFKVTESDDCGSKVYSGTSGADRIVIKDHATRLCENVVPALVEVELTRGGQTTHLYSPK